jgi:excisionase family DNA binding protein
VAEAAAYARCSERTVRRWIHERKLPVNRYRVGPRRIEIDLNEVDKLRRPIGADEPPEEEARTA